MKFFRSVLLSIAVYMLSCSATPCHAQATATGPRSSYNFAAVTTVGQLNPALDFHQDAVPSNYTLDWSVTGTPPSACTFYPEGSTDNVNWYALASASTSSLVPLDCTAPSMFHVTDKPVVLFRFRIVSYTAGNGTTRVTFNYTRGSK